MTDQQKCYFVVNVQLGDIIIDFLKGTVSVILSDPPCKDGNAGFNMVFIYTLISSVMWEIFIDFLLRFKSGLFE